MGHSLGAEQRGESSKCKKSWGKNEFDVAEKHKKYFSKKDKALALVDPNSGRMHRKSSSPGL